MYDEYSDQRLYQLSESRKQMIKILLKQRNDFAEEVLKLRMENAKLKAGLNV
jgi:hypothetical protein